MCNGFNSLGNVHLGRNAETLFLDPRPDAHYRHTPVIVITIQVVIAVTIGGAGRHAGQRLFVPFHRRSEAFHHVATRIPYFDVQNTPLVRSDQADDPQVVVEAAFADQLPRPVEAVALTRDANAAALEYLGKLVFGIDQKHNGVFISGTCFMNGSADHHDRPLGVAAIFVFPQPWQQNC